MHKKYYRLLLRQLFNAAYTAIIFQLHSSMLGVEVVVMVFIFGDQTCLHYNKLGNCML